MTEYIVTYPNGQSVSWHADDLHHLFLRLTLHKVKAVRVQTYAEWEVEKELAYQWEQLKLNAEIKESIEKGEAA